MSDATPQSDPLKVASIEAIKKVNCWRGHCIDCFARIELAATETLNAMAEAKPGLTRTPPLFGARIAELVKATAQDGPFGALGSPLRKALGRLQEVVERRNILVHATGSVWLGGNGNWLWRYCFVPSGRTKTVEVGVFTDAEAEALEKDLSSLARSLSDLLKTFRAKI